MPGTARRLVRRYLPEALRKSVASARRSGRAATKKKLTRGTPTTAPVERHDPLVEALRTGQPLDSAVLVQIRSLLEAGEPHTASSIAASLRKEPASAALGALASAIVALHRGFPALAWTEFAAVPRELRWRRAAAEYVRAGITSDRATVLDEVRRLVAQNPDSVDAGNWTEILGAVYGAGEEELARQVFAILDREVGDGTDVDAALVVTRDWLRRWVAATADSRSAPAPAPGHISFAIMDYGHPGRNRASANIGDHVQSLASLGHLVRHQELTFHGPQDLVDLFEQLHGRVRPEIQRTGIASDVELITVDRDASMYKEVPPDTWMLAFGWFMHAIFELRYGFPFHRNLRPIFLSFHCNKRDLLTSQATEYLRACGPIGCRDWTTVDILLSIGVPAFFSGCMTTTVSNVFPELAARPGPGAPVAYVDAPPEAVPPGGVTYKHSSDAVRFRSFATNVYNAMELLETYRRKHSAMVTSRLHAWLPGRSIGIDVDFQPKNRSDIRFAGLIDMTDAEFDAIRDGINTKLERVMTAILSGEKPDAVYELWRSLTAPDVAAAERRHGAAGAVLTPVNTVADGVDRAVAATTTRAAAQPEVGDVVHLALHVPPDRARAMHVLLASLQEHSSRPLHVWIVTRERGSVDIDELGRRFPAITFSVVPTRGLGAELRRGDGRKLAARELDLLVLSELLPSVDRVVVLPVDALATADVAELYDLDLEGHLLGAPTVVGTKGSSGFGTIHGAGLRLGPKTKVATELRRRAYARHAFDFDAFTNDVLVLDLARARSDGFVAEYLPYVEEFGLALRDVLHFAVGPDRAVVPEHWDCVPTRSAVARPGLVHWADPVKPWDDGYTAEKERWLAAANTVEHPPTG
jgi:Glycosyl transferase family 8